MKKILVVDDDESFRKMITSYFDKNTYQVLSAADGIEGLEQVEKESPDLILLDIIMPRMNGVEFLEKMKEHHAGKQTPIIITTNDASLDTISRGAELGVRSYMVKSNENMKSIMDSVERVLSGGK